MKGRARNSQLVYSIIAVLNLSVAAMFTVVTIPEPPPVSGQVLQVVRQAPAEPERPAPVVGIPNRIIVSSVGIDLPVIMGSYDPDTQEWTLDDSQALYADRTVPANDSNGATLIYGHGQVGVFARLPEIGEGATAEVHTDTGAIFRYTFESSREVVPTDTSVLSIEGEPRLVLQTCSGPLDAYRTLVTFTYDGVTKP